MRRRQRRVLALLSAMALGTMLAAPSSALAADDLASGLWWFERGKVQEAHDAGFDGSGVTVAVIDSQINPDVIGLRGADLQVREDTYCHDAAGEAIPAVSTDYVAAEHGTSVVSMILGSGEAPAGGQPIQGAAPGATVLYSVAGIADPAAGEVSCLLANGEEYEDNARGVAQEAMSLAISDAIDQGADVISISSGGYSFIVDAIAKAVAAGVPVVAALSNENGIGDQPAGLNGVIGVQAFGEDGVILSNQGRPNVSKQVETAGPGLGVLVQGTENSWDEQKLSGGTSYATSIVAGFLAVVKQKYPDATGNQLIQSLIHNTGTKGEHEPEWNDSTGYGAASLTGMLAVDPTTYPDVNPLFDPDDPIGLPTAEDVAREAAALGAGASPEPTETTAAPDAAPDASAAMMPWVIVGIVVLLLIIVGGIVLAVGLTRSSKRRAETTRGES